MKGLLLKEFLMYKKAKVLFISIILFFGLFGLLLPILLVFIPLYFSIVILSSYGADEKSKWTIYSQSLPFERKLYINAKYDVALIIAIATSIFNTVIYLISSLIGTSHFNIRALILLWAVGLGLSLLPFSISTPFGYRFDSKISFIVIIIAFLVPVLVVPMGSRVDLINKLVSPFPAVSTSLIAMAVIIAVFLLSWFISVKIYEKKDL